MEMPGKRSNYTLLSQFPDDQFLVAGNQPPLYESLSAEKNKGKGFDWDGGDIRNRIGNMFTPSIGLQRQSSGSSFGDSTLSGEYYVPTMSMAASSDFDAYGDTFKVGVGVGGELRAKAVTGTGDSYSSKSWAQQTEESYQLQLALALRLSSEATCADDPNFLDPVPDDSASRSLSSSRSSAEAISHRFWVGLIMFSFFLYPVCSFDSHLP